MPASVATSGKDAARRSAPSIAALLANDLIGAVQGGDAENRATLPVYVEYLTAYAPQGCYGSADKLYGWRGLSGDER